MCVCLKMRNILLTTLALATLSTLQCSCSTLNYVGTAVGFGKTMSSMNKWLFRDGRTIDEREILENIDIMNTNMQRDVKHMSMILRDLPKVQDLWSRGETLDSQFMNIGRVFAQAFSLKRRFNGERKLNSSFVELFREKNEIDIDYSMNIIQDILKDDRTRVHLDISFHNNKFENVCKTGMSHLQLLDNLLGYFKISSVQYYMAKNWIYTFVERSGGENFTEAKRSVLQHVHNEYKKAIKNFETLLPSASRELWRCDPPNGFGNDIGDSTFINMKAFTAYYLTEKNFLSSSSSVCDKKCSNITELKSCGEKDTEICPKSRVCPGVLVGCSTGHYETAVFQDYYAVACVNRDRKGYARYSTVIKQEHGNLPERGFCQRDSTITMKRDQQCDVCQCTCEESQYYLSTAWQQVESDRNMVMTGARMRMIGGNTIFLQLQQGKLLPNGTIDKSTVRWLVPPEEVLEDKMPISWNATRTLSLGRITLPENKVLVGLQFFPMHFENRRSAYRFYALRAVSQELDFRNGSIVKGFVQIYESVHGNNEYDLEDADVPTKSERPNTPQTRDDQFITIRTSSLQKDGGQSTIPFVDVQEVATNPPSPLSGAQLFIRGQEGYGGFLALKLFTYDTRKFVIDELEFEPAELAKNVSVSYEWRRSEV